MITKAIITNIDYTSNKCTIRIPVFEHAGLNETALAEAAINTLPGINVNYRVNDVVFIGFESDRFNQPIILGKLFLGNAEEAKTPRSAINCDGLVVSNNASIPGNTKLDFTNDDLNIAGDYSDYGSIADIIKVIRQLNSNQSYIPDNLLYSTAICTGPCTNLYNYNLSTLGYSFIETETYFLICYNGSDIIGPETAKNYMYYMTGKKVLPMTKLTNYYQGGFIFTDGTTCYPIWENEKTLKLIRVTTKHFTTEDQVRKLIEEYLNPVSVTDFTGNTVTTVAGTGLNVTDTETGSSDSSVQVNIIDLTNKE